MTRDYPLPVGELEAQTKLIVCMTLVQGTIWVHNGLCGDLIPCTVLAPGYSKQL